MSVAPGWRNHGRTTPQRLVPRTLRGLPLRLCRRLAEARTIPSQRRTKQKIVWSARRLFNRRFDTVSIDDVMADAGLTRGSFYSSYFESKGDLYAEAVTQILNENPAAFKQRRRSASIRVLLTARLSSSATIFRAEHFEDIDGTCPLIAFPTDFLPEEHRVRQAFETVLRVKMIDVFEQALRRNGKAARSRARAIATLCVGGMVLARSIEDRVLADEIRESRNGVSRCRLDEWPRRTSNEWRQSA